MKILRNILGLLSVVTLLAATAHAEIKGGYDLTGVGGYDLVSYHQDTGPVRGSGYHKATYSGVEFLFANEANKAAFEANPEMYLPAYNGFCAFGVAKGKKVSSDPTVYEVVDGTLYLNLSKGAQEKWVEDKAGNIEKANKNWKSLNA